MSQNNLLIKKYLKDIGVSEKLAGFTYLADASLYQYEHLPSIKTKPSLEYVSGKYNITYRNVQNSIQYALKPLRISGRTKGMRQIILECVDYLAKTALSDSAAG